MLVISLPLLQQQVFVFDKVKELHDFCLTQFGAIPAGEPCVKGGTCYVSPEGDYPVMIFLGHKSPGVIAHECTHAVHGLMHMIGQEPDLMNDEFQAYLLGYMVDCIHANYRIKSTKNCAWVAEGSTMMELIDERSFEETEEDAEE